MLCAFCSDFLLNAVGYQCEDCRYTCHKKCYEKVVTKCIAKSSPGVSVLLPSPDVRQVLTLDIRRTRRRLTIVFPTDSSPSPILVLTGAAIVGTCCHSAARTLANAQNVTLLVMQTVHIWSPISAVCLWRRPAS
jgi:hypothetical protein